MQEKLMRHLDKSTFTYEEAINEIRTRDNLEPIPEHLGDFIIAAISVTTGIPVYVIKPVITRTKDVNDRTVTEYGAETEYLFKADKGRGKGSNLVILVYNGIDYYAPAVPKEIVKLTRARSQATTHLKDAVDLINGIMEEIPGSAARDALSKSLSFMGAAKTYLEGAQLASGTTTTTNFPVEMPIPVPVSTAAATKMAHKRAAASVPDILPPEKKVKKLKTNSLNVKRSIKLH